MLGLTCAETPCKNRPQYVFWFSENVLLHQSSNTLAFDAPAETSKCGNAHPRQTEERQKSLYWVLTSNLNLYPQNIRTKETVMDSLLFFFPTCLLISLLASSKRHAGMKQRKKTNDPTLHLMNCSNSDTPHMGVSQNSGVSPKMDGKNNGKPYFLMDDLGGFHPLCSEAIHIIIPRLPITGRVWDWSSQRMPCRPGFAPSAGWLSWILEGHETLPGFNMGFIVIGRRLLQKFQVSDFIGFFSWEMFLLHNFSCLGSHVESCHLCGSLWCGTWHGTIGMLKLSTK